MPLHQTKVDGVERDVLHHFWVQVRSCEACHNDVEVHPHYQLAYSKEKELQWTFCKNCHAMHELPIKRKIIYCECGKRTKISEGTHRNGYLTCPVCKHTRNLAASDLDSASLPRWKLFAQEYLIGTGRSCTRHFKKVEKRDKELFTRAETMLSMLEEDLLVPKREIPREGRSDGRPLIHGIRTYAEFFNSRQKLHLHLLGTAIRQVKNANARRWLELAFSEHLTTNCMYTGYAFGYRRTSPMFSIHSYRHITRPVELNPWQDGIGRGTFVNTVKKISKAIAFAKEPKQLHPQGVNVVDETSFKRTQTKIGTIDDVLVGDATAAIQTQSSEDLSRLPNSSVDLVLTDPPYFDNLSYSELSDFYLAWHQELGIAPSPYNKKTMSSPIAQNLAISRRSDEVVKVYRERLQQIFMECRRVLKKKGICVFTYHHKLATAWDALGTAFLHSGLIVTKVLPMRGEGQGGLHTFDGTIKWDAVLVCRKGKAVKKKRSRPLISKKSTKQAFQEAADYFDTLSINKRIGFKEPDFTNLARALVISKSFIGTENSTTQSMSDTLKNIPVPGIFNGQT